MVVLFASPESAIVVFAAPSPLPHLLDPFSHGCIVHVCHYTQVTQPKRCLSQLPQKSSLTLLLVKLKGTKSDSAHCMKKKINLFRHLGQSEV